MLGVEKCWKVQHGPERPIIERYQVSTPAGYLVVYSNFQYGSELATPTSTRPRGIPDDTLIIALTRTQLDTMYHRSRRTFTLPATPKMIRMDQPPRRPPAHDLDSYLVVNFEPDGWYGPRLHCSGYEEENEAAYLLHHALKEIEQQALARRKKPLVTAESTH